VWEYQGKSDWQLKLNNYTLLTAYVHFEAVGTFSDLQSLPGEDVT
jgi:hypothetical protein